MKSSLNIALLGRDFNWSGGAEFLRNLANALFSVQQEQPLRLFLLLPVKNRIESFNDLRQVAGKAAGDLLREGKLSSPRQEPAFDASLIDYFKNVDGAVETVAYNEASGLLAALHRIEADVILPASASLGQAFPIPWVGYVYDLQHKYFPEYFSASECLCRDIHFATMLRDAKAVIVNSRSVKNDLDKFFPYHACRIFDLPFSAAPVSKWLEVDAPECLKPYNLPQRYFLISNQFWVHKSHLTAFKALAILANETDYADLNIVCTGKMDDYRCPDYIGKLQQQVRAMGIEARVRFLGHIPKADQIAIMKKSLAVIQPTLFEGGPGGGSVYDAVSLGVPAIVSDLPVNREIADVPNIFYFEPGSPDDLAEQLKAFLNKEIKRPSAGELIEQGAKRKKLMGERLLEAAFYARETTP